MGKASVPACITNNADDPLIFSLFVSKTEDIDVQIPESRIYSNGKYGRIDLEKSVFQQAASI
ncbi:MAG: hypothetical protein C4527_07625 [Candidatus Omnitrophota bacterium]|nr:MAG: hypothetical protein C4527_07625 [Candidatus Omnitrophota bacterium]